MSQADKTNELKIEIQKLLGEINRDMNKLKHEVVSLNHILEGDSSLVTNASLVNERLMIAAKEAGIDLEDLEIEASEGSSEQNNAPGDNASEHGSSEQEETGNGTQESTENNEQTTSSGAAELAAAAAKLAKAVKRTLR